MSTFTQEDFDLLQIMLMHQEEQLVYEALDFLTAMKPPLELWWAILEMESLDGFEDWAEWLSQEDDVLPHHRIVATAILSIMVEQQPEICDDVTHLSLMGCALFEIPEWVSRFENLQFLNLAYNPLTEVSSVVTGLPLRNLTLAHCSLTALPECLGDLKELEVLNCGHNEISTIPQTIFELPNLKILSFHDNRLTSLPFEWHFAHTLEHLDLTMNPLSEVPIAIENCDALAVLLMNGCDLTEIPAWIGGLRTLEFLSVGGNPLRTVPSSLGTLENLNHLGLWDCLLTEIPDSIGGLHNLETLELTYNQLSTLPETLNASPLKRLALYGNPLTHLPKSLHTVSLDAKQLESLSNELHLWTELHQLDLSERDLSVLPEAIQQLTGLKELLLSENALTCLPEWLGNLTSLEYLDVWLNPLEVIPDNLSSIILSYDQFERFEEQLVEMSELKHFGLINNTMVVLPPSIRRMNQLESLYLQGNDLLQIPSWISEFSMLSLLDIRDTQISAEAIAAFVQGNPKVLVRHSK